MFTLRDNVLFLVVLLATGINISCSDNKTAHPKEEAFPYPNTKTVNPKGEFNVKDEPKDKAELKPIDVYLGEREDMRVKYLSSGRYLILDTHNYRLHLYNRKKGKSTILNEETQGPKDLSWATDISVMGDSVYISKLDFRYITYYCSDVCNHERTERIPYQGRGISATSKGIFLATQQPLKQKRKRNREMRGIIYNSSLEDNTFGRGYQHDNWLVKDRINEPFIEARDSKKVVAFKYLPYIYVYDERNLIYRAKVENFRLARFLSHNEGRSLSVNKNDKWSEFGSLKEIDRNRYHVSVRDMKDVADPEVESLRTYYLNTEKKKLVREKRYDTESSLNFEPIITKTSTMYYKSGRIYDTK